MFYMKVNFDLCNFYSVYQVGKPKIFDELKRNIRAEMAA